MLGGNTAIKQEGRETVAELVRGLLTRLINRQAQNNMPQAIIGEGTTLVGGTSRSRAKEWIAGGIGLAFFVEITLQQLR